jgi:hypothetical protein
VALFNLRTTFATIGWLSINCDPQRVNFATAATYNFISHCMWSYEQTLSDIDFFVDSYGITLILKKPTNLHHHRSTGQEKQMVDVAVVASNTQRQMITYSKALESYGRSQNRDTAVLCPRFIDTKGSDSSTVDSRYELRALEGKSICERRR